MPPKILFVCVEDIFETGILQSMVLRPARSIHRIYGATVGFTSMRRRKQRKMHDELRQEIKNEFEVLEGNRSDVAISVSNIFNHFIFAFQVINMSRRYDVLHCRSYMATFIGCFAKILFHKKVIFDVRGYLIDEAIEVGNIKNGSWAVRVLRWIERFNFKYSDSIISVSEKMSVDIKNRFDRKSLLIPNPTFFPKVAREKTDKLIVYNGSLNEWHNPEHFFSTAKEILSIDSEYKFRIVTGQVDVARKFVEKFQIDEDKVEILTVRADEVIEYISQGAIGWCIIRPSFSKSVCAPVKFNEYLAAGLHVIVNRNIGDLEDLVRGYDLGVVIPNDSTARDTAKLLTEYVNSRDMNIVLPEELKQMVSYENVIDRVWVRYLALSSAE